MSINLYLNMSALNARREESFAAHSALFREKPVNSDSSNKLEELNKSVGSAYSVELSDAAVAAAQNHQYLSTSAETLIRDADFAPESSNFTRNQILVQSGISALTIANQRPQAILQLLR